MEEMKAREDERAAARKQVHIGEFVLRPPQQGGLPRVVADCSPSHRGES